MSIENRSHAGLTPTSAELKGNKVSSLSSSETKLSICNLVKNEIVSALREDATAPATTPTALRALTTIMDSRNLNHELSAVDHALAQPAQEYTRNRLAEIKKRRKVVNQVLQLVNILLSNKPLQERHASCIPLHWWVGRDSGSGRMRRIESGTSRNKGESKFTVKPTIISKDVIVSWEGAVAEGG